LTIPTNFHKYVGWPLTINIFKKIIMDNINKFKKQRKKLRFTQISFCSILGISQGYLSDLENNIKLPSKSLMLLLDYISESEVNEGLQAGVDNPLFKQQYLDLLEKHTKVLEENISLKEKLYGDNSKINGNAA
jgi:transcriptional regulator with XRE-family HTH domain